MKGITLMFISSICVALGQLFWKLSHGTDIFFLGIGSILYGAGALLMMIAYRYGSLSVLQPILSLSYVFSLILASAVLSESIGFVKCIGVFVILGGVALIAGGDKA